MIISPESWDHIWISKHHYAKTLAEMGACVVFANPPKSNWKITPTETQKLRVLDYPKFVSALRKFPNWLSRLLIKRKLSQIEKYCQMKFDIVWSFDNSVFFDFTLLKPRLCISHIVDLNQDFEFQRAYHTSDIFLACSTAILDQASTKKSKAFFINHGYSVQRETTHLSIAKNKGINVGYAGNLDLKYIDWVTLNSVVASYEQCNFHFAGPGILGLNKTYENVFSYGPLSKSHLTSFYDQMHVLIICYDADNNKDQLSNPHKMMEYLGTGKPIVASLSTSYRDNDNILMSDRQNQWPYKFEECLNNFDYWNSFELIEKRKKLSQKNTYKRQSERIEKLINHHG